MGRSSTGRSCGLHGRECRNVSSEIGGILWAEYPKVSGGKADLPRGESGPKVGGREP